MAGVAPLPTYRPDGQGIRPAGIVPAFGAQALGSAISRLGQVADQGMDEVGRRQYQQAALDGAKAGFDAGSTTAPAALGAKLPQDPSAYGDAFRRGAVQAASAQVGLQARADVLDLADKYKLDPTGFRGAAEARMRGFVANLPPELRDTALDHYSGWTYRALSQIDARWHEQQTGQQRATVSQYLGTAAADAGNLAYQGDYAGTLDTYGKAKDHIDEAVANGILSPAEGQAHLDAMHEQSGMNLLRGLVSRAPDPEALLRGLKDGKTGDDVGDAVLASLPVEKRLELVSKTEAEVRERRRQADYDFRLSLDSMDPQQRLAAAKSFLGQNNARLYASVEAAESGGDTGAVSPKGALGVMQLMPDTARETAKGMGLEYVANADDASLRAMLTGDPGLNRRLGQAYLGKLLDRYDGNRTLALAAFNAGPGKVDEWLKANGDPRKGETTDAAWTAAIPYRETSGYVTKVLDGAGPADATAEATVRLAQRQASAEAQAQTQAKLDKEVALRADGRPIQNPTSEAEFKANFTDPAAADKAWNHEARKIAVADAVGSLKGTPLADRDAMRARLTPTDENDPDYADKRAAASAFDEADQADRKLLLGDPGLYAQRGSQFVAQGFEAARQNPDLMSDAIGRSLAYQKHMGLNDEQTQPLPKDFAGGLVKQFQAAATIAERLQTVRFVANLDDATGRKVLDQLEKEHLPKGVDRVVDALQGNDVGRAEELARRISMDPSTDTNRLSDVKSKDVTRAVADLYDRQDTLAAAEWQAARLSGQPQNDRAFQAGQALVTRIAKQIAGDPGQDAAGAAQKAMALVYGDGKVAGYEGLGVVKVPPGVDAGALTTGLEGLRASVDLSHIAPTEAVVRSFMPKGTPDVQIHAEMYRAEHDHAALTDDIRRYGTWVGVAGGYALVGPAGGFVPGVDGNVRVWSAQDALQAGKSPAGEAPQVTPEGQLIPRPTGATLATVGNPFK